MTTGKGKSGKPWSGPSIAPEAEAAARAINLEGKCDDFLREIGLEPTPDAREQLAYAFVPALRIMIERGYDPAGQTWKNGGGWMGLVFEIKKKTERLWWRAWRKGEYDKDVYDIINYAGMYARSDQVKPWGTWGAPYCEPQLEVNAAGHPTGNVISSRAAEPRCFACGRPATYASDQEEYWCDYHSAAAPSVRKRL